MKLLFVILFLVLYAGSMGSLLLIGWLRQQRKERKGISGSISLDTITVIIPFRNEADRITGLINSILASSQHVKQTIFINDHSTDNSSEIIQASLADLPILILDLPVELTGKKQAIKFGINRASTSFILTLDADVSFHKHYFEALTQLKPADFYILPVTMKPIRFWQYFLEFDLILLQALNAGVSGWFRPIVASGANLLFSKSCYDTCSRLDLHEHISSGDDIYLLRDFREAKKRIFLSTDLAVQVETEAPPSLREFLHQRLRWIAKSGNVNDVLANSIAISQGIISMVFFGLLIYFFISCNYSLLAVLFVAKYLLDIIFFAPSFTRNRRTYSLFFLPFYQLFFPFYYLLLLLLLPFFSPKWKGRNAGITKQ
jgi:glycosyltransferase involved in cell wall biosynthesis